MKINELFDSKRDIYRAIEKVITYRVDNEKRLESEISEYIVTENIEKQFENLLSKMQLAMRAGGENEVGVWVSGFYGSGKSSFTKYLGMAFDESVKVNGIPFLKHLQNRLHKPQTKALLSAVAKNFPAAIVLLDLASEMLAGASMADISTVLYYKVLQWAGYSENLKIAAFERKLQKDNRYDEFKKLIKESAEMEWASIQNDPLVVDSVLPEIAHAMYPNLYKNPDSFKTEDEEIIKFENVQVQEMIEIVRETTGKEYIIFVIDEVGQYIGSRPNLILNLDGLSKNFKHIGDGKVWIISTAQQTLTQDDPRAVLNSPELYKLKDRFPIQIDLESSDIKEICYRRLLTKSNEGKQALESAFEANGQALRHNTKLHDAKFYETDFDKEMFVNLYPFLPAHFSILLHLLGALSKSTGGVGLRSAIKVVQDILIDPETGVANNETGWLATTVTLFDSLEKDIKPVFRSIYNGVEKTIIRFSNSETHINVAKSTAVLQILNNLPITIQNLSALMHPGIESESQKEVIEQAVNDLIKDPMVPFGDKEGNLCFFSEKVNDIDQEKTQIPTRSVETNRIFSEAIRETFNPLPQTRLDGTLVVKTGIKLQHGTTQLRISGDRETIQTIVGLISANEYENSKDSLIDESRHRNSQNDIYLIGRTVPEIDEKVTDIYRCQEICRRHRNEPDQEVKDYCAGQMDRANKLIADLQRTAKECLTRGSFIFHGHATSVDTLDQDLLESSKKLLSTVAGQVFYKYSEASVRVQTDIAEKFLRIGNLAGITSAVDPLGLVQDAGGTPRIKTDHNALISVKDYIDKNGTVEGKRLLEIFSGAPYGWAQDTVRYLLAALLLASEIKLKVAGHEVTVNGQKAIDALKTNNSFKRIGIALRDERPSMELLATAAKRLGELIGDTVVPLEDDVSKAATKHFPHFQQRFAPLGEKLAALGLPGSEKIESLSKEIADVLFTDASDAPQRLGGEESALYEGLKWANEVDRVMRKGLEKTIRELQIYRKDINDLPASGTPGNLKIDLSEVINNVKEKLSSDDFHRCSDDLNTSFTSLQSATTEAAKKMYLEQKKSLLAIEEDLNRIPEWNELNQAEQSNMLAQIEELTIEVSNDLDGLKKIISQKYVIDTTVEEIRNKILQQSKDRRKKRLEDESGGGKKLIKRSVKIPANVTSVQQIDLLINQLQQLKHDLTLYKEIEISMDIED